MRVKNNRFGCVFPALLAAALLVLSSASRLVANSRVVAVYVTGGGDISVEIKESVGAGILNALTDGEHYTAVGNGEDFLTAIDTLKTVQIENVVYDDRISEIGAKFGADFVCVAEITKTSDAFHVLTRMIDVQTAKAVSVGNVFNPLRSDADFAAVSGTLVKKMAGERIDPPPFRVDISDTRNSVPPPPPPPSAPPPSPPPLEEEYARAPMTASPPPASIVSESEGEHARAPMTGFSLGYGLSQDAESKSEFLRLGFVHTRPISAKAVSFNFEGNLWFGTGEYTYKFYDGSNYNDASNSFDFFGANVPLTFLFQLSLFSFETGLFADALFVDSKTLYNAGFVAGIGITFDKKYLRRYFYRYHSGFNYGTHAFGMWWLF
jgi:hypothetical protein